MLVLCDTSKGGLYKEIKQPLVGEHAFKLTGFVCKIARVTIRSHILSKEPNEAVYINRQFAV